MKICQFQPILFFIKDQSTEQKFPELKSYSSYSFLSSSIKDIVSHSFWEQMLPVVFHLGSQTQHSFLHCLPVLPTGPGTSLKYSQSSKTLEPALKREPFTFASIASILWQIFSADRPCAGRTKLFRWNSAYVAVSAHAKVLHLNQTSV